MNSNVTFSTVEFSTSYASNVVNGMLDDAISADVIASLVLSVMNIEHISRLFDQLNLEKEVTSREILPILVMVVSLSVASSIESTVDDGTDVWLYAIVLLVSMTVLDAIVVDVVVLSFKLITGLIVGNFSYSGLTDGNKIVVSVDGRAVVTVDCPVNRSEKSNHKY